MFKYLTALLVTVSVSVSAQEILTYDEAIAIGLEHNFDIQIARNNVKIASNNNGLGLSGFLPKVDVSAKLAETDNKTDLDKPPVVSNSDISNKNAEVSLNWVLFDGFNMFVNKNRYTELKKLTEAQVKNQIENIIVQISSAYFNVILQSQLYEILNETSEISKVRLEREKVRNELGGASSKDYLNALVSFNADKRALLNQELNLDRAKEQLNILLGRDAATALSVSDDIQIPKLNQDYESVKAEALERNSNLKAAELNKIVAERNKQLARSPFLPKVSFVASYGYFDRISNADVGDFPNQDVNTTIDETTVGLQLTFNIFNGNKDNIAYRNAKLTAHNQKLSFQDTRNRLIGLITEVYDTYEKQMEIVQLEESNIAAALTNLELQRERLELGSSNSLEFRDAQLQYNAAQTSLFTAKYQARISRLEVDQLIGIIKTE